MMAVRLALLLFLFGNALSYPNTVPPTKTACTEMLPGHGPGPQKSPAPYQVTINKYSVQSGNNVEVTLTPKDGEEGFIGFFVQARNPENKPIGEFIPTETVKTNSCFGKKKNGAHHSGNNVKNEVKVFWKSPSDYNGPVTFTASFVRNFETFWTMVKAKPVNVE